MAGAQYVTSETEVLRLAKTMIGQPNGISDADYRSLVEASRQGLLGAEISKCFVDLTQDNAFQNLVQVVVAGLNQQGAQRVNSMSGRLGDLTQVDSATSYGNLRELANPTRCGLVGAPVYKDCMAMGVCAGAPSSLDAVAHN